MSWSSKRYGLILVLVGVLLLLLAKRIFGMFSLFLFVAIGLIMAGLVIAKRGLPFITGFTCKFCGAKMTRKSATCSACGRSRV